MGALTMAQWKAAQAKKKAAQDAQDAANAPYFAKYFASHPELKAPANLPKASPAAFVPFETPTKAPVGSYDPAYDAQVENANQGFGWTAQDYDTSKLRLGNDYGLGKTRLGEDAATASSRMGADYQLAKGYLSTDHQSALGDLLTSRNRGTEDYNTASGNLARNYSNLGDQQNAQARSAGVGEGGALAQALLKRQANQGRDQSAMDTQNNRFMADNATATSRQNDSFNRQNTGLDTNFARGTEDQSRSVTRATQDMDTNYFRGNTDLDTNFTRAGIQNDTFGRQINTQTLGIAAANGGLPTRPENEHTFQGITYQNEVHNGKKYRRLPNGRLVPVTQKLASAV